MADQSLFDYFTQIDSREGLFVWMVMLISFLFGFLIAYLLRSGRVRRLKQELAEQQQATQAVQATLAGLQTQLQDRTRELQEESQQRVTLMNQNLDMDAERQRYLQDIVALNRTIEELKAANRDQYLALEGLKAANRDQQLALEELRQQPVAMDRSAAPEMTATPREFGDAADFRNLNVGTDIAVINSRLEEMETLLLQLATENKELKAAADPAADVPTPAEAEAPIAEPELRMQSEKTVLYEKIIISDRPVDDLTQIEGIGEFIAKKLNSIGVFTYADIAAWAPDQLDAITAQLGYLPGRIAKDRWVEQAQQLVADAPPVAAEYNLTTSADDLQRIEGIGPKIEGLLHAAGIYTWEALSNTEPSHIKSILDAAGDQYRIHDPSTWPLQARLAAAGDWDELDAYQAELKGGRE